MSLRYLVEDGLLDEGELAAPTRLRDCERARYGAAKGFRERRLRRAFQRFQSGVARHGLEELRERERFWLADYALFAALKRQQGNRPWFIGPPSCAVASQPRWTPRARRWPKRSRTTSSFS